MKRLLTLALALVALGAALAQEERSAQPGTIIPIGACPKGWQQQAINLTAPPPVTATPNPADFPISTSCSSGWEPNFGGDKYDRCFKHTFSWRSPGPECRCLSGELTIHYKANQAGTPTSGAGNDTVALYSGQHVIPGTSQALYSGVVTKGQTGTKTIKLSCDWLKNNRLSFLVQDDTSVTSATLHVVYCCPPCPKGQVEETFPGTKLKYCCDNKPGAAHFCCTAKEGPAGGENPQ
ncbi:MAG: hypothetical protein WAM82_30855 [Thermoanaerobaculia bacterium]